MTNYRPTLRQLEYVVALADTLSFRRAAELCYVTQPALSTQLRQLEQRLGVTLFERDRRNVLATPAGASLAEQARGVLTSVDALVASARGTGEPLSGELRLGVIPTIAPYLLPQALAALRASYPQLELFLREDATARLCTDLRRGHLDVLLLAREAELGRVEVQELFSDAFLVALPATHPLATADALALSELASERLILLEEGH